MIVINLFSGPGAGKSTGATYVFSYLKMNGVNAEYVPEYAKDLAWEKTLAVYYNQFDIGVQQYKRIHRLEKDCDVVVTDSPLFQQQVYTNDPLFAHLMTELSNRYDNRNYFVLRNKPFNPKGRNHDLATAVTIDKRLMELMDDSGIKYQKISGDKEGYDFIVNETLNELGVKRLV